MKKILLRIFGVILVIVSILLALYPFISNYLMSLNKESEISAYEDSVESYTDGEIEQALKDAKAYNKSLFGNVTITDPFDPDFYPATDYVYESLLNLNGDGIMGYVEIPVIDVNLPIYHGTSNEVLYSGTGHLQNTSLPVGGEGTHAVLTGHTGLPSAKLFTDLNQLVIGDVFYIHVLNQVLAYQVDQIKVVLPDQTDDLKIDPEQDYVSLITCTPYGINSHRLLVRGTRIPYDETQQTTAYGDRDVESTWMLEYKKALIAGAVLLALIIICFVIFKILRNRRKKKNSSLTEKGNKTEAFADESPPDEAVSSE